MLESWKTYLKEAEGYMELGMLGEASITLDKIDHDLKTHPLILGLRLEIYKKAQKWSYMATIAEHMIRVDSQEPEWYLQHAYAVQRSESAESAKNILLNAETLFPDNGSIQYQLGIYECQLGNINQAKERLLKAIELEPKYKSISLKDKDYDPVWKCK